MDANEKIRQPGVWYGGALSGLIAGLAMALVLAIHAQIVGTGFFTPIQAMAAMFMGPEAMAGGFGTVLMGLIVHLVVSAILGIVFAFLVNPETSGGYAFFGGLVFALVIWAAMTYLILPGANPVLLSEVMRHPGAWAFSWMVFGGVLAATPSLERATGPKIFRPGGSVA